MGKGDSPDLPPPIDPNQSAGEFLFGSDWRKGRGITDPEFQRRLVAAEAQFGPQYLENALNLQEGGLFGTGDAEGLLSLYERAAPITERMRATTASAQREADIADVERLGGRAVTAIREADPERAALIGQQQTLTDELYRRAEGLTPEQRRMAVQSARQASVARGREMDNSGMFAEALGREEYLRANRAEAQGAGLNLFNMLSASGADPMQAVLGRPAQALPYNYQTAGAAMGLGGQASPQLFNPDAGMNLALAQRGQDTEAQSNIYGAQQASTGSIMGGLFSALGALGGAALLLSDERVKKDKKKVGELKPGVGLYEYKYKGEKQKRIGPMAQEVAKVQPDAVVQRDDGLLGVNMLRLLNGNGKGGY